MSQIGWDYKRLEEMGVISPVAAVDCKYKVSTYFADVIAISVTVEEFKGVKLKLRYEMKRGETKVCEGHSDYCFLKPDGKIINIKREYPEFYKILTELAGN